MVSRATAPDWERVATRLEEVRGIAREFGRRAGRQFGPRLKAAKLFGSAARGDWQEDSDVDVLVVLDDVRSEDRDWIATTAVELGVLGSGIVLATVTLSAREYQHLLDRELLFGREVAREGIPL
jgi:predicted nucleotidyltransferase